MADFTKSAVQIIVGILTGGVIALVGKAKPTITNILAGAYVTMSMLFLLNALFKFTDNIGTAASLCFSFVFLFLLAVMSYLSNKKN